MSEEMLDIVNEHDAIIDRQTRGEAHRQGLKHRAAHVLVFNRQGDLFLQKRSRTKDTHPGVWDSSASGHLDCGETYDACATRELREELGWQAAHSPARLFKIEACEETGQEFVWVYRCEAEGPFSLNPQELERGGWFAPEIVTRWMAERAEDFAPAFRTIWRRLEPAQETP